MKKQITSIFIMLILIIISFLILLESSSILESVTFSFNIWKNNIFPSLFPFFFLSGLLINYGFVEFLAEIFGPIMIKLFKTSKNSAFIFIMSILTGFPGSAKYVKELHDKNLIDEKEATKILMFSHFSNPLFILGTISILFLNNSEAGFLILICHYLGNIIIGLLFRNYNASVINTEKISIKKAINNMHKKRIKENKNLGTVITDSLNNSINSLLLILGVVTISLVLTTIINNITNINNYYQSILNGFVEMTQGLKYVSILEIPLKLKSVISTMIISFGGLSVHIQIVSILSGTKIKYLPFLTSRIIHAFISSFLVYILFDFFIKFI